MLGNEIWSLKSVHEVLKSNHISGQVDPEQINYVMNI